MPLVVAVFYILAFGKLEWSGFSFILLYFSGALIRIASRRVNFEHTRLREISAPKLILTGVYSVSRNPLYVSNLCIIFAFLTFNSDLTENLIIMAILMVHYQIIALTERDFLIQKFAQNYFNWAKTTPFWIGLFKYVPCPNIRALKTTLLQDFWTWFFHFLILGLFICKITFYSSYTI